MVRLHRGRNRMIRIAFWVLVLLCSVQDKIRTVVTVANSTTLTTRRSLHITTPCRSMLATIPNRALKHGVFVEIGAAWVMC